MWNTGSNDCKNIYKEGTDGITAEGLYVDGNDGVVGVILNYDSQQKCASDSSKNINIKVKIQCSTDDAKMIPNGN